MEALESRWLPSGNTISGYVFADVNNNGLFDPGESPIANSTMQLVNSNNQVVATATSNAQGYYEFNSDNTITPSEATLTKTLTFNDTQTNFSLSGAVDKFDPSLGTLLSIDIIQNGTLTSTIKVENTSPTSPSTITGTVSGSMTLTGPGISQTLTFSQNAGSFNASAYDTNIDFGGQSGVSFTPTSVQKSGSTTITGAAMQAFVGTGTVTLGVAAEATSFANGGGNLVVSLQSSASAQVQVVYRYLPSNALKPGNYTIVQTPQPAGYFDGKESAQGVVLNTPPGMDSIPVTLVNQNVTNNNFGEIAPASISGYVYADTNNNGIKDPGEAGIQGTTVSLAGVTDQGVTPPVATTTDANGFYQFTNLRPGTYSVSETQPAVYLDGKDTPGSQTTTVANDAFSNLNLAGGQNSTNNNFGELSPASLSGYAYVDANGNGSKDSGEAGIQGVTITLSGSDDKGAVNKTATTDANGFYQFTNLRPGSYAISETQPSSYLDGQDNIGSQGGTASNDQFTNIALAAGTQGANNNFGEVQATGLSGYAYVDANNNGVKDPGEAAIQGVVITLTGTNDQGPVNQTATTDANGFYQFLNLRPGTYALSEAQPAGYLDGKESTPAVNAVLGNDAITNIALLSGNVLANNNFGELRPASLSGYVYVDANNNGVKDPGEVGIQGVAVQLTGTDDKGIVMLNASSDANGFYQFLNLRPGTYTLSEEPPIGYLDGLDAVGSVGGTLGNDVLSAIALAQNGQGTNYNFGEQIQPSISGYVYVDTNKNGVKDSGEAGIAGVQVNLTGFGDQGPVNLIGVTDSNGFYRFQNLRPGVYGVSEVQPVTHDDGQESVGSAGGLLSANDQISNIALAAGVLGVNYNFGEISKDNADLAVFKTADQGAVPVAGTLNYTITVFNLGATQGNNVVVTDTLPPGTTFVSASGNGWTITQANGVITATLTSLAANASAQFNVTIKVPNQQGTITNTAAVTSTTPDSNPNNNSTTITTLVYDPPGTIFTKTIVPLDTSLGVIPIISKSQLIGGGFSNLSADMQANMSFISGLYATLTGKSIDGPTMLSLLNQLKSGSLTQAQLVAQVWNSDAHRSLQATQFYQTFYNRPPTAAELQATMAALKAGTSEMALAQSFLTSTEYLTLHPTSMALVTGIQADVLGVIPSLSVLNTSAQTLATTTWNSYVQGVLYSAPAMTEMVDDVFRAILRRVPTSAETATWVAQLMNNQATPSSMTQTLLLSAEFQALALAAAK